MHRATSSVARASFGAAVAACALASVAGAQTSGAAMATPQASSYSSVATGVKTPTLLRADSPGGTYNPLDPSLANYYGATQDGVSLNGVGLVQTADPNHAGYAFFCTGERIGPATVLLAAHCVTDENTGALLSTANAASVRFIGPGAGGVGSAYYTFTATNAHVQSSWQGFNNANTLLYQDVAVLNFGQVLPSFITTYSIFNAGALGSEGVSGLNTVNTGIGTFGTGVGATGFDGRRRSGNNVVDYVANNPNYNDFGDLYLSYEDANNNYNSTCALGAYYAFYASHCYASRGNTEAGTAPGDSGGPLFINGQIAGVTSFGSYYCDPTVTTDCVPFDVADANNAPFTQGGIDGFAPVYANLGFINAVSAPEPSTVALAAFGLAGLGAVARRRRQS